MNKLLIILLLASTQMDAMIRPKRKIEETTSERNVKPRVENPPVKEMDTTDDEKKLNEALHEAIGEKNVKNVTDLIKKGADVNNINDLDYSPLMFAVIENSLEIVDLLLKNGAKTNVKNNHQTDAFHLACTHAQEKIGLLLLQKYRNLNAQDLMGITPLMAAVDAKNSAVVKELLLRGAMINKKDKFQDSALTRAIKQNNKEMIEILLQHISKKDLNERYCGQTPLIIALKKHAEPEVIKMLLSFGADPSISFENINAYALAEKYSLKDKEEEAQVKEIFEKLKVEKTELWKKIEENRYNPEVLFELLKLNPQTQNNGKTLLYLFIQDKNIVNFILGQGADCKQAFIEILRNEDYDKILRLIELGADINSLGSDGETILDYAIRQNYHFNILEGLIKLGADINILSRQNKPPVVIAAECENIHAVKYLIDFGCKIDANISNQLFEALIQTKNLDLLKFLLNKGICMIPEQVYKKIEAENSEKLKKINESTNANQFKQRKYYNIGHFNNLSNGATSNILDYLNNNDLSILKNVSKSFSKLSIN